MRNKAHDVYDTGLDKLVSLPVTSVKKVTNVFLVILVHFLFYSSTLSNSELCFVQIIFCVIEVGSELIKPASLFNRFPVLLLYYSIIIFTLFSFVCVKKLSLKYSSGHPVCPVQTQRFKLFLCMSS